MRFKLIACEAIYRECCLAAALSPHVVELAFVPFGLHNTPAKLREAIQAEIDACEGSGYDYLLLGYGLCSRGTAELRARSIPLVIPRAHDCITLLLGSRARYDEQFAACPGTYYYSAGWVERKDGEVRQGFVDEVHEARLKERYEDYVRRYGEDNAKFLIEQERRWEVNYTRAAFIDTGVGDAEVYRRFAQEVAASRNWEYAELEGDTSLLERMANGEWLVSGQGCPETPGPETSGDFLVVPAGKQVGESFDAGILAVRD